MKRLLSREAIGVSLVVLAVIGLLLAWVTPNDVTLKETSKGDVYPGEYARFADGVERRVPGRAAIHDGFPHPCRRYHRASDYLPRQSPGCLQRLAHGAGGDPVGALADDAERAAS